MSFIKITNIFLLLIVGSLELSAITIESRVNSSYDDAEEFEGSLSLTSSDLELVQDKEETQIIGMRFGNMGIPKGAIITSAYIQFMADEVSSDATTLNIYGEKVANAVSFARENPKIGVRVKTSASTSWSPAPWNTTSEAGVDQRTSDLSSIVQELVNQAEWVSDNAMVFLVNGTGKRVAEAYDGKPEGAPLLHVEYEEGIAGEDITPPIITLNGSATVSIVLNSLYTEEGAIAIDETDGEVDVNITGVVDTSIIGTYTITYSTSDIAGNVATITRTINVVDEAADDVTAPIITLNGSATVSIVLNSLYTEEGAIAIDETDGELDVNITGVVDTLTIGTYIITYSASDISGNSSTLTRTITVIEEVNASGVINRQVNSRYDDAEELDGSIKLTSSSLELGEYKAQIQSVGMRFGNMSIPKGSTITRAYIQFMADGTSSDVTTLNIYAEKVPDALDFSRGNVKISERVKTLTSLSWSPVAWSSSAEAGVDQQTIDLKDIAQELVNQGEWVSGNAMVFIVDGTGMRVAESFDGKAEGAPLLHIEYRDAVEGEDVTPPIITLNGSSLITLTQNSTYIEEGAIASDDIDGAIAVTVTGEVDTLTLGTYTLTYTATDSSNNSSSITRTVKVEAVMVVDALLLLNEYNAVSAENKLKLDGSDTLFGQVNGNGGSWFEMLVVGTHVNIQEATIRIREEGNIIFEGIIPAEVEFGHLRRGTIITVSEQPTDMSYEPFSTNGGDWTLNLNINDLTSSIGSFETNSNALSIEIISNSKTILAEAGENISGVDIDNQEVFKLKKDPLLTIAPSDSAYGDDIDQTAISTFGSPNQWMDGGVLKTQDFTALRVNRDLNEVDGIALSHVEAIVGLKDAESLLYVAQNNSLWISDDNARKIYEMDFTTKEVKTTYTSSMFEDFSGICRDENNNEVEDCVGVEDLESVVYDDINDILYVFSGSISSIPTIFRLTRESLDGTFVLDDSDANTIDFRILDAEYQSAQFVEGEIVVAMDYELFNYDFQTDTRTNLLLTLSSDHGKAYGMAYDGVGGMWIITSKNNLLKIDWSTKQIVAEYKIADDDSIETFNGVYDTRGLELINNKMYILEGMNASSSDGAAVAPYGSALKNAIHIYAVPADNL